MASLVYNSCIDDMARGAIDFDTDTFRVLLVTSAYTPDKDTHTKRNQVTNEVATSGSYTNGTGLATTATVTKDTANDRVTIAFSAVSATTATITARAAVIFKSRGGASSSDELVAYVDFGSDVSSSNGTYTVTFSTPLTLQN